jgi:hypothetical protein
VDVNGVNSGYSTGGLGFGSGTAGGLSGIGNGGVQRINVGKVLGVVRRLWLVMIFATSTVLLAMDAVVELGEYVVSGRSENRYGASVESVEAVVVEFVSLSRKIAIRSGLG